MAFRFMVWIAVLVACDGGTRDAECGAAEASVVSINGPFDPWSDFFVEETYAGKVSALSPGAFALTTDVETIDIRYAMGGHTLPIAVGDDIVVMVRSFRNFGATIGMALWTTDDHLLAALDAGTWGSAWQPRGGTNEDLLDGFAVGAEPIGCAAIKKECADYVPVGLRFTHGASTVVVPPEQSRDLVTSIGAYRVVNVGAYSLAHARCTDMASLASWAILALDGSTP